MPEKALLTVDIRTVPRQDHNELQRVVEQIARDLEAETAHLSVKVDVFASRPWTQET